MNDLEDAGRLNCIRGTFLSLAVSEQVAFDNNQQPTQALRGFCKKNGISVDDVFVEADAKGVEYAWVNRHQPEDPAAEVSHFCTESAFWIVLSTPKQVCHRLYS